MVELPLYVVLVMGVLKFRTITYCAMIGHVNTHATPQAGNLLCLRFVGEVHIFIYEGVKNEQN